MYLARDISSSDPDHHIRAAALVAIERLSRRHGGRIRWADIQHGFNVDGERIFFASRAQGIFKPKQMSAALSIRTVIPRAGRKTLYRDQDLAVENSDPLTGLLRYDLAHGGTDEPSNRSLQMAMERRVPLIYFAGFAPSEYQPVFPVWVVAYRKKDVLLTTADVLTSSGSSVSRQGPERSYSTITTRFRKHQTWFSACTKAAYGYRCAFSGLPVRELLVGAHIMPDADGGPASVNNGICMSTLHHSAYDSHLIGVDPDYKVHVAPPLRENQDGDLLATLKDLNGTRLRLPSHRDDWPSREFLESRFETFKTASP